MPPLRRSAIQPGSLGPLAGSGSSQARWKRQPQVCRLVLLSQRRPCAPTLALCPEVQLDANIHREILTWAAVCKPGSRPLGRKYSLWPTVEPLWLRRHTSAVQRGRLRVAVSSPKLVEGPRPVKSRSCCPATPGRALGPRVQGHTGGCHVDLLTGQRGCFSPPCWGGQEGRPFWRRVGAPRSHK